MTTPTIKQMRAWQRQLGSMERKWSEFAREVNASPANYDVWSVAEALTFVQGKIADDIIRAKSEARRQGFASMTPERVAELSRLAVEAKREAKRAKKTV